jgi:SHS2 domain-containing protein
MGYEELHHTADWSVRVWAEDLPQLFAESARAMNALSGLEIRPGTRVQRTFESSGPDPETLLVSFLSELIYLQEQDHLGFDQFEFGMLEAALSLTMEGGPVLRIEKAIKAVTWHEMHIERTSRGLESVIIFDV